MVYPTTSVNGFPIINLQGRSSDADVISQVTQQIDEGLRSHTCFYLVGHGVAETTISSFFEKSKTFFGLPEERKLVYKKGGRKGIDLCGYSRSVKESFRERFDFKVGMSDDNSGIFPEAYLPGITSCVTRFDHEMTSLLIRDHQSALLGQVQIPSKTHMSSIFYQELSGIGANESLNPDLIMERHTDMSTLTFLFSTARGLQVQLPDQNGEWLDVEPIEGAIFVNVGDMLESLTHGEYLATLSAMKGQRSIVKVHRVKHFPEESGGRQSLAYFLHPDANVEIHPFRNMAEQQLLNTAAVTAGKYFEIMMLSKNPPFPEPVHGTT